MDKVKLKTEDLRFREGQTVAAIHWANETSLIAGENGVEKITVVKEQGQLTGVPWFVAWAGGKPLGKYNSAFVKFVTL